MKTGMRRVMRHIVGDAPRSLDLAIDREDEMYLFLRDAFGPARATMTYVKLGHDLTASIMQIIDWRFPGKADRVQVMEFACGYGRNLRHLVHRVPPANIFVSDIYAGAVRHNIKRYGVRGRVSVHDPVDLNWPERFDLIVVPSLFSHLPDGTFAGWIAALDRHLTDEGILAFSTHGDHIMPLDFVMPESGIHFVPHSESRTLDKNEYGGSIVNEAYVREQIRRATGHATYSRTNRGFWNYQDLYLVPKDPRVDMGSFRYDFGIVGAIDAIAGAPDGALEVRGWAKDTHAATNGGLAIRVEIDGRVVGQSDAMQPRPDVDVALSRAWGNGYTETGFTVRAHNVIGHHRPDSELVVKAVSRDRTEVMHALSLGESLAPPPAPANARVDGVSRPRGPHARIAAYARRAKALVTRMVGG